MGTSERVRRILNLPREERDAHLLELHHEIVGRPSRFFDGDNVDIPELVRRIFDADRSRREEKMMVATVLATIAAVLSAATALTAIIIQGVACS